MEFWTVFFEISVTIYFGIAVILLIRNKSYRSLSTMITGAIFGVVLEFVNVFVTHAYHYSNEFIIQVGTSPSNIPLVIGLAWGILLETSHQISGCFKLPIFIRTIFESVFVVSIDLFLDVVAVRLDGGFWIWASESIVSTISTTSYLGIPYGNFYGWFCVIFFSSLVLHLTDKVHDRKHPTTEEDAILSDSWKYLVVRVLIAVIVAELLLFGFLNLLRFAFHLTWLFFLIQYVGSIIVISLHIIKNKIRPHSKLPNIYPLAYYIFFYLFCIITMITLGLVQEIPVYFALNIIYGIGMVLFIGSITQFKKST